jgi:hypothetical protein
VRKEDVPEPPWPLQAAEPRDWTRAWARVLADPSVKNTGFALLTWADYGTGAGIHPGVGRLMQVTGIKGDHTVRNALKQMRDWGFIWRYLEGSKAPFIVTRNGGRKRPADEYRLTFPGDISRIPMLSPDWEDDPDRLWTIPEHRS